MEAKQDLELTIRTATVIKSLSRLVGASSALVAKMTYAEAVGHFVELGKFIEQCNAQGKRDE